MDWLTRLESPNNALAVLTAMITPAVLISACGALIFSTGTRLGRVIDRVRFLAAKFEELAKNPQADDLAEERRTLIFTQLERQMTRARMIQRAMVAFYTALGVFVGTSVAIAVLNSVARTYIWVAVVLGPDGSVVHALRQRAADHRVTAGALRDIDRDGICREGQSSLCRRRPGEPADRRTAQLVGTPHRIIVTRTWVDAGSNAERRSAAPPAIRGDKSASRDEIWLGKRIS